ncbi:DUF6154 family protein [Lederbergia sp. NSJ-179]|uniref:DUF6154 family protein n=1 Tax=Lederbergia sp. NSJ-179 TaxID=2931402 RepID=UPI001FD4A3B4|nr:DUF6154 family protein [Lederbergia sp. NSJ-179]MCJ7842682.1 DUF6154 family protein [Lederbergia sp. NSJ-179]
MKLVDELFAMYQDKITDEEDIDMITFAVLEHYNKKELLQIVKDMNEFELQYFIRLYLLESLKGKMEQAEVNDEYPDTNKFYH